jgi:RNA-directed DNA polymerase
MAAGLVHVFPHRISKRSFRYVDQFAFSRVVGSLHKRHLGPNVHTVVRRGLPGWENSGDGNEMFRPRRFAIARNRYRGSSIPTPLSIATPESPPPAA